MEQNWDELKFDELSTLHDGNNPTIKATKQVKSLSLKRMVEGKPNWT